MSELSICAVRLLADLGVLYRTPATGLHEIVTNEYGVTYCRRGNTPGLTEEEREEMDDSDWDVLFCYGVQEMRERKKMARIDE